MESICLTARSFCIYVLYNNVDKSTPRENKCQRIPKGQLIMYNPEILATQDAQDEEKQNKNTTQYTCVGHNCTQTNTNNVNKT